MRTFSQKNTGENLGRTERASTRSARQLRLNGPDSLRFDVLDVRAAKDLAAAINTQQDSGVFRGDRAGPRQ
jgi:hypothetical protein